ncbi:hypothetical protein [Streptomyces sp. NPDC088115]
MAPRQGPDDKDRCVFWPVKAVLEGLLRRLAHPTHALTSHDPFSSQPER